MNPQSGSARVPVPSPHGAALSALREHSSLLEEDRRRTQTTHAHLHRNWRERITDTRWTRCKSSQRAQCSEWRCSTGSADTESVCTAASVGGVGSDARGCVNWVWAAWAALSLRVRGAVDGELWAQSQSQAALHVKDFWSWSAGRAPRGVEVDGHLAAESYLVTRVLYLHRW